jgi:hypothetical protein
MPATKSDYPGYARTDDHLSGLPISDSSIQFFGKLEKAKYPPENKPIPGA